MPEKFNPIIDPSRNEDRKTATPKRFATLSITGFTLFIAIMSAFHFIQPELNPLTRFGSEYVVGRAGWLMNLAFFCFATGLLGLAFAFSRGLEPPAGSRAGVILLVISSLGILGSGIFNADLQGAEKTQEGMFHDLSGFLAFLTLIPAIFIFSRRLHLNDQLRDLYRALRHLAWLILLLFLAMLFVFGPFQLVGLGQRLFLASLFSWLMLAAYGIKTEAFGLISEANHEAISL